MWTIKMLEDGKVHPIVSKECNHTEYLDAARTLEELSNDYPTNEIVTQRMDVFVVKFMHEGVYKYVTFFIEETPYYAMETKKPGGEWKRQPLHEYKFEAKAELSEYIRMMRDDNGYNISHHGSSYVISHHDDFIEFARVTRF